MIKIVLKKNKEKYLEEFILDSEREFIWEKYENQNLNY